MNNAELIERIKYIIIDVKYKRITPAYHHHLILGSVPPLFVHHLINLIPFVCSRKWRREKNSDFYRSNDFTACSNNNKIPTFCFFSFIFSLQHHIHLVCIFHVQLGKKGIRMRKKKSLFFMYSRSFILNSENVMMMAWTHR